MYIINTHIYEYIQTHTHIYIFIYIYIYLYIYIYELVLLSLIFYKVKIAFLINKLRTVLYNSIIINSIQPDHQLCMPLTCTLF